MSNVMPCGQAVCPVPCHEEGHTLGDILSRFERDAVRGVCDTGRYRCAYWTWGQGPPLVFLHGLADAARAYLPVAARLACAFRCVAYELPSGRGDGARLRQYTHDHLVDDLFALLDHLGMRQSYVFGSSFGSTIALAAMHREPTRIPRGLLGGGFAYRRLTRAERLLSSLARWWPGSMRHLPLRAHVSRGAFGPTHERAADLWRFFLETSGTPPIAAVARRALQVHRLDLRPLLNEVRQPILLVCGDADPVVNWVCEEELLKSLPHVQRVELQDCGHLAHYSHPDVLAAVVRHFLTPHGQPAACAEAACPTSCSNG